MLKLADVGLCIQQALEFKPNGVLAEIYGDYYSPYYAFFILAMAIGKEHDKVAVELGCDMGRGLASLAYGGGSDSKVIGIDHTRKAGIDRVESFFPTITFVQNNSNPPPPEVPDRGITFLHIDTEHSYAQAETEFEAYKNRLTDGAIVVFDDLHAQEDDVLRYFYSLPYPKVHDDRLHPSCGWGVVLYQRG